MEAGFVVAMVVGLMEVAPGVCQMELLNPDGTINTSQVQCEMIAENYTPLQHTGICLQ